MLFSQQHKSFRFVLTLCLFFGLLLCHFTSCSIPEASEPVTKTGFYLDTVISVTLYPCDTLSREDAMQAIDECFQQASHYESLFSNTIKTSDISKINASLNENVEVNPDTLALLKTGLYYCELSEGAFDITIGKLSELWDFKNNDGSLPDETAITEALSTVDYRNLSLPAETDTGTLSKVTLQGSGKLDLGGIAKGYIADKMKEELQKKGITEGVINLGGNVLTLGPKANGECYTIGLQKPFSDSGEVIAALSVSDASVVTSGIYQRYFEKDGQIYHHLLDTKTGQPIRNGLSAVTIVCPHSVDGDALSTYVFTLGLEKGVSFVEAQEGIEAVFITEDNRLTCTDGLNGSITIY